MVFDLTIGGVAKQLRAGSLRIMKTANGRATASFEIVSSDRSYRPAQDADVVMEEDGVVIFGGRVDLVREQMFNPAGIVTWVSAVDYNGLTERRAVLTSIPAGNLKAALTQLVSEYLADFSVTLHASQVNGVDLPYLEYGYQRLTDVLNELASRTAGDGEPYVWSINANKELRMYQPSTVAAPFDLVGNDLPEVIGDIEVETSRADNYANYMIGRIVATTTRPDIFVYVFDNTEVTTHGPWERVHFFYDNPSEATATEFLQAELAKSLHPKHVVRYRTWEQGIDVGQEQLVNVSARNVNLTGVITELTIIDRVHRLERAVTVTVDPSLTNLGRDWRDVYKIWAIDKRDFQVVTGESGSGHTGAAPPDTSVQFNDGGVFGGDSAFTWKKDTNSVVCGSGGSSISADNVESCQVFGYNCHITN